MNFQQLISRYFRRLTDLNWIRNSPIRRSTIIVLCGILFLLYFFFFSSTTKKSDKMADVCIYDQLQQLSLPSLFDENAHLKKSKVSFVGNGYIGMDVAKDKQLLMATNNSKGFSIFTSFYPLIEVEMNTVAGRSSHLVTDFIEGVSKSISCSVVVSFFKN